MLFWDQWEQWRGVQPASRGWA